jgi:hypothetical protein
MRGNVRFDHSIQLTGRKIMRGRILPAILCSLALVACQRPDDEQARRDRERHAQQQADDAARKAGQAAYTATHDAAREAKHAAKQLGRDLQQAQKGWDDAKHQHDQNPDKKQP